MQLQIPGPTEPLMVVLKLVGETCNINCHYCYERRKPYDRSQYLRPEAVEKLLAACGSRSVAVVLHGGEPLLMKQPRMAGIFKVLRAYPGPMFVSMQTNGTLLDDAWLDFFEREWPDIDIGISIDGDAEGNAHRVDFQDRPVYDRIVSAFDLMARRGRPVGAIAVVTRRMLGRAPAVLDQIRQFPAIRVLKLSPCFDFDVVTKPYRTENRKSLLVLNPTGKGIPGWATTPLEYSQFAIEAFDHWREQNLFRQFAIEPFISIMRTSAGLPTGFESYSYRKAPYVLTLYPDGRIGTTDEIDLPGSLIGHIDRFTSIEELTALRNNAVLRRKFEKLLAKCDGCSHATSCRGGMLSERIPYDGTRFEAEYCESRKVLIDHIAARVRPYQVPNAAPVVTG